MAQSPWVGRIAGMAAIVGLLSALFALGHIRLEHWKSALVQKGVERCIAEHELAAAMAEATALKEAIRQRDHTLALRARALEHFEDAEKTHTKEREALNAKLAELDRNGDPVVFGADDPWLRWSPGGSAGHDRRRQ